MEKRKMEQLGIETSLLGFGCMRFPTTADGNIDEDQAEKMLDAAYDAGVNYFDTAYNYHGGKSEVMAGKALAKHDRSSFFLATKLPVWLVEKKEDVAKLLNEQLSRLNMEYVDFYLLHALNLDRWENVKKNHVLEACEELRKQGKIRYLGFSFHDKYEVFEEILNAYHWDFCQIQYNYMDTEEQAGDKGYALAKEKGIPMVVMEPVRGGSLAGFSPEINQRFQEADPNASIASYALRWVGSHSNVKVVLSGMSNMEQAMDNCKTFGDFRPLDQREESMIEGVAKALRSRIKNGCTGCSYCMPCPVGVNIPGSFRAWNEYHMYGSYSTVQFQWEQALTEETKPKNCVECGKCESACPQHLSIRADLKVVQKELDKAKEAAE
ncbi:MAG: aldo/keto reductase [Lachnospiraceae bacterium]|nr:aldo/keto reductase [Lachnospiraceae bacterium]